MNQSARAAAILFALVPASLFSPAICRPDDSSKTIVAQTGELPQSGRVVIRSGMAWLNESAPVFQRFAGAFSRELVSLGLTVITVPPSDPLPMPKTPLPARRKTRTPPMPSGARFADDALAGAAPESKAMELGRNGKLPKLTLRHYATPRNDADLPQSVKSVTAPDVAGFLYARSQQSGHPVVDGFAIPGRLPEELVLDAEKADYAVIVRFASVRARAAVQPLPHDGPLGTLVAAAAIGGVGSLGFGVPAAPMPPGRNTYGTPGGYVRGYEGSSPNDIWHRDNDFFQRDYMFKHGPQPNYATPPSGLSPSRGIPSGAPVPSGVDRARFFIGWRFLLLDVYGIAPMRAGKKPEHIWRASARCPEDDRDFAAALPEMARAVFAERQRANASSGRRQAMTVSASL